MKQRKIGFTVVEVSLIIILLIIGMAIVFPYFFNSRARMMKDGCRINQSRVYGTATECLHRYPEYEKMFREMETGEICEFLCDEGIIKSREMFSCPSSTGEVKGSKFGVHDPERGHATPSTGIGSCPPNLNDYDLVFNIGGKLIDVECEVEDSHNRP